MYMPVTNMLAVPKRNRPRMDASFPVMSHSDLEVTYVVEEACSFDAEMYPVCVCLLFVYISTFMKHALKSLYSSLDSQAFTSL